MTLTLQAIVVRSAVYASRVKDDLVFFDEMAGRYFATGTVGADIWELIETPRSLHEICVALMERYEVDEMTCVSEVERFVDELLEAGLVQRQ